MKLAHRLRSRHGATPYYYGQTPAQLLSYFRALGKAISGKWFAYNFPARTGCDLTAELVATGGGIPGFRRY